jgi:DNA-binding transcriptional regulator YhcF (GntR family)
VPRDETDRERIAGKIRARIVSGHLRPGDRIPSAAEIAKTEGVHSRTAQHALSILKSEALITTHYGRGSFVSETPPDIKPARSVEDRLTDVERRLDELERRDP